MDNRDQHFMHNGHFSKEARRKARSFPWRADLRVMREFNRLLVLNEIRRFGPLARVALAQRLGLSRTTVSSIIEALLQERFVREGSLMDTTSKGGRRATLVHFNADVGCVLGIDVGRTHLTLLLTNLAAEILAQHSQYFDTEQGPDVCLPKLVSAIHTFIEQAQICCDDIIGVGLGIPGPLDVDLHKLSSPPHMPGWDEVDIWQVLSGSFHVPILIDNDANMGALSESRCGAGRGHANLAYIKIGTGIGCGLVLNGHIYRGHSGSAGEIGHQTIDENGPLCTCGNRGCLETLASARAIVVDASQGISLIRKRFQEGALFDETFATVLAGEKKGDITEVIQAAQEGDAASVVALERAGERIGIALAGLINLLNPSAIVIDGGAARAGEVLMAPLRRVVEASSLPAAWQGTHILQSELGTRAIALGAVLAVIDAAFAMPVIDRTSLLPMTSQRLNGVSTYPSRQ